MAITYPAIAAAFKSAVAEQDRSPELAGAIRAMEICPEACAKVRCFNDTIWEIVADTLNAKTPVDAEMFERACALLESLEG